MVLLSIIINFLPFITWTKITEEPLTCCEEKNADYIINVRNLVFVSGKEVPGEVRNKVLSSATGEEALSIVGKAKYRLVQEGTYTFLIQEAAVGANGLAEKKVLLDAMFQSLSAGEKALDVSKLTPEASKAVRDALWQQSHLLPSGLRHLVDAPNLRLSLEPIVTGVFDGPGGKKQASAYPVHNENHILTPKHETGSPKTARADSDPVPSSGSTLHFYFSKSLLKPSSQMKAMQAFAEWSEKYLQGEVAAFNASYTKTLNALLETHRNNMGGDPIPKASDVSKLPKELQDSFVRNLAGAYSKHGFDSEEAAQSWFYGAKMTSSSTYINLVVGGFDFQSGSTLISSISFDRP